MTSTLQDAVSAVRDGDYEEAQRRLAEVIRANPDDVQAWYLLSQIVDSDARRAAYLSKTLALNPYHERAWAEFYSLPTEVVSRLEPGQAPVGAASTEQVMATAAAIDVDTALPDWLRPVAKDQPVMVQRRATPPAPAQTNPTAKPPTTTMSKAPAPEPAQGNRTLSVLLAILLIATILVLAFLVYLLLQG